MVKAQYLEPRDNSLDGRIEARQDLLTDQKLCCHLVFVFSVPAFCQYLTKSIFSYFFWSFVIFITFLCIYYSFYQSASKVLCQRFIFSLVNQFIFVWPNSFDSWFQPESERNTEFLVSVVSFRNIDSVELSPPDITIVSGMISMTFTMEWKDSPLHREVLDSLYRLLFSILFDLLEDVATLRRVFRADNRDNYLESKLLTSNWLIEA